MQNYYIYKSKGQSIKLIFLCSLFVIPTLCLLSMGYTDWQIYIGLIFALGYPIAVYNYFDKSPQITLNTEGIYYKKGLTNILPWQGITYVELTTIGESKDLFIRLCVQEEYSPKHNENFTHRLGVELATPFGYVDGLITFTPAGADAQRLKNLIVKMMQTQPAHRDEVLSQEMNMITWKVD